MISENDWSGLITVNYRGGFGGDFFTTLLDNNFNKTKYVNNSNFKYEFVNCPFNNALKHLSMYHSSITNVITNDHPNMLEYKDQTDKLFGKVLKIYNDSNFDIETCFKHFFYDNFKHNFVNKIRVANCHNLDDLFHNRFDLQKIFPKSYNIKYSTVNKNLFNLYQTIFYTYKIFPIRFYPEHIRKEFVANITENNEHDLFVDSYELIFCNKNYDKILSDYCNCNIRLDYSKIEQYKQQNLNILKKYQLNLETDYSLNELIEITEKIYYQRRKDWDHEAA